MKRIIVSVILIFSVIIAADKARAESSAFSKKEWAEIKAFVKAAYPRGSNVKVVANDPWLRFHTIVECSTSKDEEYILLHVNSSQAAAVVREANETMDAVAEKIREGIEIILQKSAQEAPKK
jgi:RecA-family ATPase